MLYQFWINFGLLSGCKIEPKSVFKGEFVCKSASGGDPKQLKGHFFEFLRRLGSQGGPELEAKMATKSIKESMPQQIKS